MADQVVLIITILVVAASVLFDWWYFSWLPSKKLPPGPTPWPIVGSFFKVRRLGANPLTVAMKLEGEYGKVITLWIGRKPIIVISDAELAHEALVKRGALFASKSKLSSTAELSDGFPMINTSDGAYSVSLRRVFMSHLLNPTSLKAMKPKRDAMVVDLIKQIKMRTSGGTQNAGKVMVTPLVRFANFEYGWYVCFGLDTEKDELRKVEEVIEERIRLQFSFYVGDYIPLGKIFERKQRREFRACRQRVFETLYPYIQKYRVMKQNGTSRTGTYIEALLDVQEKKGPKLLTDLAIVTLCTEYINSSTHTMASAVAAALFEIAHNPELQIKLSNEIDGAVGSKPVDETDLPNLPFLLAVCKEALRLHPPVPAFAHAVAESCELGGHYIPTDAVIYFHVYAYHHSPEAWTDPWDFKPERFLNKEVDLLGSRDAHLIPFGAGRRVCAGLNMALMLFPLTVSRFVQAFHWDLDAFQHTATDVINNQLRRPHKRSATDSVDAARDARSNLILHPDSKTTLIARPRFLFISVQTRQTLRLTGAL